RRGEAAATLSLVRAAEVLLSVHRSGQGKELAAIRLRAVAGANVVRLTPRFGRRTLAPGLYDVKATTSSAVAGTQSKRVRVRVLR
ncbi:MAG: hypothetical protein Q7T55_00985, partial [Solirubrobacteraceae bacterium]|nr:hypothetical protein [Solirubrobacteraceae bacterium]